MTAMTYDRLRIARMLFEMRRYREAVVELESLLDSAEEEYGLTEARELLARAAFHAAYLTKAERFARELIDANPTHAYAHTILVRTLQRQSRHDEAERAAVVARAFGAEV